MKVKITDLVSKVIKNLDENEEIIADKVEFGYPGSTLPELIADILPDVAANVVAGADLRDVDEWLHMDEDFEWTAPGRGEMSLPQDFLRLVVFRMSDWKRSVSSVIFADSPVYSLRFAPSEGRRGIRKSPAVAIVEGATRRFLEFIGSTDPAAYPERCGYLPVPDSCGDDSLWIPRSLLADVVEKAALKVRSVRGS